MRALALILLITAALPASAQTVVTSAAPERVGVTVYRDLSRGSARPDLSWLGGYALISETRSISLPAGESELRFEGVASGIIPQSAIVGGVPEGLIERNRDALLLSAGSLIDRSLGERVALRRTSKASGKVTSEEAIVRTGSDGGVVLQTAAGFEALRCSGLNETLVYNQVPPGLSAKPTLSVRVRAGQPLSATVTLSYLATGFDWQADYVAMLSPDEGSLQLQAWLTLASSDDTSFRDAVTQAVAGKVNREDAEVPAAEAPAIRLQCWPQGKTSDVPPIPRPSSVPPPPPPPAPLMEAAAPVAALDAQDVIVTGSRVTAKREKLGDLQLYRIPDPVTVASNAQKQVGLLDQPGVRVTPVYRLRLYASGGTDEAAATLILKTRNRQAEGLGLPLPAGNMVLFREHRGRPVLIGEARLDDQAVGDDVEFRLEEAPGVRARLTLLKQGEGGQYHLELSNDRSVSVTAEVRLEVDEGERIQADRRLNRRDGASWWDTVVPANGRVTLDYRIKD